MESLGEKQLVCILRDFLLSPKPGAVEKAWVHKNLGIGSKLYNYEKARGGGSPWPQILSQPEVDLLVVNDKDELFCVEVKFFHHIRKNGKPKLPYYSGLGQALALTNHGFPAVFLWHFFTSKTPEEWAKRYYLQLNDLISKLRLPVNYRAFVVEDISQRLFKDIHNGCVLAPGQLRGVLLSGKSNPQKDYDQCKDVYKFWREHLGI